MTATTPDELTAARRSALLSGWVDAVLAVAAHYQIDASRERIRVAADWSGGQDLDEGVRLIARQAGLALHRVAPRLQDLTAWRLPVVP